MSKIADLYADQIKRNFKVFYANWEPGGPVELGDYGIMNGNIFTPVGKLKNDFAEFKGNVIEVADDATKDHKEFKSEGGVQVNMATKGSLSASGTTLAKASLEIKFTKKDSVFFNAAECTTTRISNKVKVGKILKSLLDDDRWEKRYCVVTELVTAGKTLVAISQSNDSAISFEADSPTLERINLTDASIKINLASERSIGYKVDAGEGLIILLGLCKMKNAFPWIDGAEFEPKTFKMTESTMLQIENEPKIKTENNSDELYFGQMGKE